MSDLVIIVPSRGRPKSVVQVATAWTETQAFDVAELVFAIDQDDPLIDQYRTHLSDLSQSLPVSTFEVPTWIPMVPKLNAATMNIVWDDPPFAVGFAGDDHRPRTSRWATRYVERLQEMGTGIVYGDDLIQGANLPTQWAMTSNIVRELGAMVPADVDHLYCDNVIMELGVTAGCIAYLPDVIIEHMHPIANKSPWDDSYRRVNSGQQFSQDGDKFSNWQTLTLRQQAEVIRTLRTS